MSVVPDPEEVYERAEREGHRRMQMPLMEQASTGFIAGVTIIFGIVALGVIEARVAPRFGDDLATLAGATGFGIGVVFLVAGRSELFSENFFDPVAAAIEEKGTAVWMSLLRLWGATFVFNLVGGAVLVAILSVEGALPEGSPERLVHIAELIADKSTAATLARSVLAGALVTLLSYMLTAADSGAVRILAAYMVGFVLALGPFDHVVVSALHVLLGIWLAGGVTYGDLATNIGLATVGNLVGGLFLITLSHTAQVKSWRRHIEDLSDSDS